MVMIPSMPATGGIPSAPSIPQPGIPEPEIPEPSSLPPPSSNALWFWVKEDLEALRREISGLGKKLEALEGRVTALEAGVQAAVLRS